MNKSAVFAFFLVVALAAMSCAAPVEEDVQETQEHVIAKRATCDLLSFEVAGVKANHAACAAHCLTLKKKGGQCNSGGVCVCRN